MAETLKEITEPHLLTPQHLLDKYEKYLDFISTKFKYKGLEKDDVYNQAYLELLELYLQFPGITEKKLKNKVTHKLWNYLRKEQRYWNNNTNIDAILDVDDEENDKWNVIDKQTAKVYFRDYNRSIPFDILESIEEKQGKEIINMYFFYGYKEKEIAKYCNLSQQRINKIKSRALKKIKEFLL